MSDSDAARTSSSAAPGVDGPTSSDTPSTKGDISPEMDRGEASSPAETSDDKASPEISGEHRGVEAGGSLETETDAGPANEQATAATADAAESGTGIGEASVITREPATDESDVPDPSHPEADSGVVQATAAAMAAVTAAAAAASAASAAADAAAEAAVAAAEAAALAAETAAAAVAAADLALMATGSNNRAGIDAGDREDLHEHPADEEPGDEEPGDEEPGDEDEPQPRGIAAWGSDRRRDLLAYVGVPVVTLFAAPALVLFWGIVILGSNTDSPAICDGVRAVNGCEEVTWIVIRVHVLGFLGLWAALWALPWWRGLRVPRTLLALAAGVFLFAGLLRLAA